MWLSLILFALFLATAYFLTIQGMFSAMIMFVLTSLSLAIAFNSFEYVALNWLSGWQPDLAVPIAFAGTFLVPLIAMRAIFDALIRRMVMIPIIADRIGGAVFGILTGLLIVGSLALAIQMIPIGGRFLGYQRVVMFEDPKPREDEDPAVLRGRIEEEHKKIAKLGDRTKEHELWLTPDRFTVGYANMLSRQIFSGTHDFDETHPDLVQSLGWNQATEFDTLHFAPPGSVEVRDVRRIDYVFERTNSRTGSEPPRYEPIQPERGSYYAITLAISQEARDRDGKRRLMLRQMILVGKEGGRLVQYHPIAIVDATQPDKHVKIIANDGFYGAIRKPAADILFQVDDGNDTIEVVFELPDVPDKFKPAYLVYKQGARAAVKFPGRDGAGGSESAAARPAAGSPEPRPRESGTNDLAPSNDPPAQPTRTGADAGSGDDGGGRAKPPGRIGGGRVIVQGTHYGDDLPVLMTAYRGRDEEVGSSQTLVQGHLVGDVADQGEKREGQSVARFKVPSDKRLLHLNIQNLRARSGLGKAISQTIKTLQNFRVIDEKGATYTPVGKYASANVNGTDIVEIMYFPEYAASGGRGTHPFDKIQDRHLSGDDYQLVYLFLVEPGAKIVEFKTGTAAAPAEDLRGAVPDAPP